MYTFFWFPFKTHHISLDLRYIMHFNMMLTPHKKIYRLMFRIVNPIPPKKTFHNIMSTDLLFLTELVKGIHTCLNKKMFDKIFTFPFSLDKRHILTSSRIKTFQYICNAYQTVLNVSHNSSLSSFDFLLLSLSTWPHIQQSTRCEIKIIE